MSSSLDIMQLTETDLSKLIAVSNGLSGKKGKVYKFDEFRCIKIFSEVGIKIHDCHCENIIFDNNDKLTLIDTKDWKNNQKCANLLQQKNFKEIDDTIRKFMFGNENLWIFNCLPKVDFSCDYVDFYETVINCMFNKQGSEVKVLKELRKVI